MINKKNIIIAAVLAGLMTSIPTAEANSSNNLLKMDVNRSSVSNSVDVTFYTTGESQNTVVTRKAPNRYVVLLPNISGSSSIVPSLGGVKDLITDVQVKNVDDGIGGYTKITFGTTKPVNIRTYMKKTAPLTQAQKDYKNLIAQNNKPVATHAKAENSHTTTASKVQSTASKSVATVKHTTTVKPVATTKVTKPQAAKSVQAPEKKVNNTVTKNNNVSKVSLVAFNPPKAKNVTPIETKKVTQPKQVQQPKSTVEQSKVHHSTNVTEDNYIPKMKFDANGKRQIDLEPRVNHKIVEETSTPKVKSNSIFDIPQDSKTNTQKSKEKVQKTTSVAPVTKASKTEKSHHFPVWLVVLGSGALAMVVVFLVFDAVSHASEKDSDRLKSFFNISSKNQARRRKREYQDIIDNEELNWQEKYKLYTEKDKEHSSTDKSESISYVTDMSATKKAVVTHENTTTASFTSDRRNLRNSKLADSLNSRIDEMQKNVIQDKKVSESVSTKDFKVIADSIKNIPNNHKETLKENLRSKISQMEHAFNQTTSLIEPPEEVSHDVQSEDNAIIRHFSDIKLKSFAKGLTLKETHRTLAEENKKVSKDKNYKESRFVKLKNSPLSMSRRKAVNGVSNIMPSLNKVLMNNGEMEMDNQNYELSSLDEYLTLLDSEEEKRVQPTVASVLSQVRPSEAMSRSGITNPISRASNPMNKQNENTSSRYMNGLIVKSGYNIDSEKGFYLVNLDGVSAIVGRVKDDIFILKKFDHVVDKQLQVRQDYGSVYIVKVGSYKCLVDVAKNKMGTLIEI